VFLILMGKKVEMMAKMKVRRAKMKMKMVTMMSMY